MFKDQRREHYELEYLPELRGGLVQDFIDGIRSGRPPLVTPERGRQSLLIPLAAERSLREQRVVHVDELEA